MKNIITLSLVTSSILMAGGYKIPEQSINSMALGAAYVANTTDADTAYYNPASMSFMDADSSYIEMGLTLAHLPSNTFKGTWNALPADGESEVENLPIPYMHYVSPEINGWRLGLSTTVPAGLTKRWLTPVQKLYAEEFTLKNIEINPVASYKISDYISVGGGVRAIYSEGKVYGDGGAIAPVKREMEGDTIEWGYNLALSIRPRDDIKIGVTYRSEIMLDEEGQANLYLAGIGKQYAANVSVPIPAALNIGISKQWSDDLTVELVYERTYWSAYKTLDFEYGAPIPVALVGFDTAKDKLWEDTNTYRIGLTYQYNDRLTLMAGYSYDETPVPAKTLSYELPDSDAHIFSAGFKYRQTENLSWGMAILYDKKVERTLAVGENDDKIVGTFSDGGAILGTVGISYRF